MSPLYGLHGYHHWAIRATIVSGGSLCSMFTFVGVRQYYNYELFEVRISLKYIRTNDILYTELYTETLNDRYIYHRFIISYALITQSSY